MADLEKLSQPSLDGVAQFYLEGVDLHRGELHAVFRTFWEGRELGSIGLKKDKSMHMKDYIHITVTEIFKGNESILVLRDTKRSYAKVKLLVDGAPVPGYPEIIQVSEGQTLSAKSIKRAMEAAGVKNIKKL